MRAKLRAEMGRNGIAGVANAESSSASLEDQLRLSADLQLDPVCMVS